MVEPVPAVAENVATHLAGELRIGVETTMRYARTAQSATKRLRRFIGLPAIPVSPPLDEARTFQPQVVQRWGKFRRMSYSRRIDGSKWVRHHSPYGLFRIC